MGNGEGWALGLDGGVEDWFEVGVVFRLLGVCVCLERGGSLGGFGNDGETGVGEGELLVVDVGVKCTRVVGDLVY